MPAASNPLLTTEQALWALVIAWPGLTQAIAPATTPLVKPGNRMRFDVTAAGWPDQAKPRRNVADTVELKLEIGNGRPDPVLGQRTFCSQPNVSIYDFQWTVVAGDHLYNASTQVISELKACMVSSGPQLGLAGTVLKWEQEMRPGKLDAKERALIWVMRITLRG